MSIQTPLRVLVADDQALVRTGFRMILAADGIEVVGEAANGLEAVEATRRTRPDVVLMDIRMPQVDGLEATRRILGDSSTDGPGDSNGNNAAAPGRPRIIILTTFDLDRYVYEALAAGASGFLLKDVTPEHLVGAVRLVRSGDALLAPTITRRLVERFARHDERTQGRQAHRDLSALTQREVEVLQQLGRGLSNAELAAQFHLSEATVKTHVARILAKLRLRDRAQAVVIAYESGLVRPVSDGYEGVGRGAESS
ncbi:MAG TPA: response regulator transcription factor [Actinocrinis sp.]|nr:response regulator transcription factor [Actinocrinis sp.]